MMNRYEETFATWNSVASLYESKFMDLNLYDETYDFVCGFVSKENPEVLEIGCGPGNITKYLLSKRPDFKIYGIDAAPNMVALAKKNNPTAKFCVMDTRNLNLLHTKYNAVICGFCLPYLSEKDTDKMIADCSGLLHFGGLLYLSFVEGNPEKTGYITGSGGGRVYFYYHSLERIKKQLAENKFEILKIFEVPYNQTETHTILTAVKQKIETK